ncbi:MAG: glycosyltransferase family 9 protein [Elusimicrobiales bacterium]|nr:glycosyltransferase family 9 protein [Elusimicrobiales bacterium]
MRENPRILLVRTDRIGDVTLTTPAAAALKAALPGARLHFLAGAYARPVLEKNPALEKIITLGGFFATLRELRRGNYDAAVVFFVDFRSALLPLLAGIPLRVGPASKVWSLFLNRRITQHRSRIEKHEADYNLDLLAGLGLPVKSAPASVTVEPGEKEAADRALERAGLRPGDLIVGVHPGSRGSAMNWPPENFAALASRLMRDHGVKVLLTGSAAERPLLEEMAASIPEKPAVLREELDLRRFMALVGRCSMFVTNSTGPLHLAAAQNVPTLSFFPPIKVCSPRRWGPYGGGVNKVLTPSGPECPDCSREKCARYNCMSEITVDEAYAAAAGILAGLGRPARSGESA